MSVVTKEREKEKGNVEPFKHNQEQSDSCTKYRSTEITTCQYKLLFYSIITALGWGLQEHWNIERPTVKLSQEQKREKDLWVRRKSCSETHTTAYS